VLTKAQLFMVSHTARRRKV